ncbi:hypothetical protein CFO_g2623 [Ceratocystis platani]|uniref:GrpE protein homolog n=1 Tax=Ceratocystis fimbriata f. sp. platani TaxID=88771 RepID=A0A0F8CWL0_CERFI|nr:hypothetical protein CFO_g2623 [Ceratocystis platani]
MLKQSIIRSSRVALRSQSIIRVPFVSSIPAARSPATAVPQSAFRWYSSEAPPKEGEAAPKEGEAAPKEADDELSILKKKLETKEKEALEFKDRYLRSVADFRNLQDRMTRDMKSARDFAIQKFAKDLTDSVDNLDRALVMVPEAKRTAPADDAAATLTAADAALFAQDLANLYEGLKMTENILVSTLAKHGLERFDPEGSKFNPNEHDATFMAPQADKEDGTVFHVQQKGFKLNGRVLRAAKVGVVKNA